MTFRLSTGRRHRRSATHFALDPFDLHHNGPRDTGFEPRIDNDVDHALPHAEFEHARMKRARFHLGRNLQKSLWNRGYRAGQHDLGRDVILVAVCPEGIDVRLPSGLEYTQAGGVGVMEEQVRALAYLRQGGLLGCANVVEVAGETH